MTCSGFSQELLGGCSMIWIALVILAFIVIFARRWVPELIGIPWSTIGCGLLGGLAFVITATVTCSHKFALVAGFIGCAVGGYFGGLVFGDGGGGY